MRRSFIFLAFAALLSCVTAAKADDHGSPDDAKGMAVRAAALMAKGPEKAFQSFTAGAEGFKDRDLYVFAYDSAGNCMAHGANAALVGKNLIDLKDFNGEPVIRNIVAVKNAGWVDYLWKNPVSAKIEKKHAYIVRSGDYVVGVGAYMGQQ